MKSSPLSVFALFAFLTACVPVDNSGGEPPAGDTASFELIDAEPFCGGFGDEAWLIATEEDKAAVLEDCTAEPDALEAELDALLAELTEDQVIVFFTVQLGGCLQGHSLRGVYSEGETIRPWIIKQDTSYGVPDTACTSDIGEATGLLVVDDASEATSAELHVGIINPDLDPPVTIQTAE